LGQRVAIAFPSARRARSEARGIRSLAALRGRHRQAVAAGGGLPNEFVLVSTFMLIGQGPNNNIVAHSVAHGYFDEEGEDIAVHLYYSGWNCR